MTLLELKQLDSELIHIQGLAAHVGNTPLIPLQRVTRGLPSSVEVYIKAEWFNPGGSVKDRPALNILRNALADRNLVFGRRLLDSTSGNMGISYATFGAAFGIPITLTVPANASPERIAILQALGAEIVLTDPSEGSDGAILEARKLAANKPDLYWYANQYDNPANWLAHYLTTGPEILEQTDGRITHFVAGLGTSGTMMGVGRCLRERNSQVKIISMQPDAAFHGLEGLKYMPAAIRPEIYDRSFADANIEVRTETARAMVLRLAREEGLFVGISSGAAAVAALEVAATLQEGVVVTIFPDAGYKYLSERSLWEGE
ncbi:MAG: cysteine synthase family protein [Chloroflexi bacterium]|nr:cysteine synthase family protein [Chloroflexota bacterium]